MPSKKYRNSVHGSIHKLIDAFEHVCPDAGTIAHCVIEDYNIRDCDLRWDIEKIDKDLNSLNEIFDPKNKEKITVRRFLFLLLSIPEETRAKQAHAYYDWDDPDAHWTDYMENPQ